MNLWKDYLKEREGLEVLEKEHGFATYIFRTFDCYIQDIYVVPEKRNSKFASHLADEVCQIAKEKGFKTLTGSVDLRASSYATSEKVLKGYGMRFYKKEGYITYYYKEIS